VSQQQANKRRGAAWEIDLTDWFMENGLNAQRLPRAGRNDVGDVFVPGVNGNYRIAKRLAVAPTPLVIIKASNKGVGEAYVVQKLSDVLANL